jgi:molybdopterin molybdotransferase
MQSVLSRLWLTSRLLLCGCINMAEFLKLQSLAEAKSVFLQNLGTVIPVRETIDSIKAAGRVLAESVIADEYLPAFSRSSMDGYAVNSADTFGTSESLPGYLKIIGELPMGAVPSIRLMRGEAALIHTGGMIAQGADAVVTLELSHVTEQGDLEVFKPVSSGENIIFKGEDVVPGDEVMPAGKLIKPADVGGLFALGKLTIAVAKKPLFAILSSGDEVIPPDQTPKPGQVRDINSEALAALIEQNGADYQLYPIIPDDREQMRRSIRLAFEAADAVVVTAGSSASSRDMTADMIRELGVPGVLVHGINIRPGKPTILAVCNRKPVVGLPGNPISALVIAQFIIKPLIEHMLGMTKEAILPLVKATLTVNLASLAGREEWIPVKLIREGNEWLAEPIFFKSNLIFQLSSADGLMKINADATGKSANSQVEVLLL